MKKNSCKINCARGELQSEIVYNIVLRHRQHSMLSMYLHFKKLEN